MANTSNQAHMFASRPLAELQAENAAAEQAERERQAQPVVHDAAPPRQTVPVPVVDISFEDLPDQEYEEFAFPLRVTPENVYVLGIDDDAILFEIMEVSRDESPNAIIEFVLTETFRRAVRAADGTEVENGLKVLLDAINPNRKGEKESRKYLMEVVLSAIDRWAEELTDTSMRPQNRAQRRRARRR